MTTPNDIAAAAERCLQRLAGVELTSDDDYHDPTCDGEDRHTLADAYLAEKRERELTFAVNEMARIERAVMDPPDSPECWPDWVYEARRAVKVARSANPAWMPELLAALGWQGGTSHQALNAVRRLMEAEKEREKRLKVESQHRAEFE